MNSAPPADPDWTAQLEKERQEEIQVIGNACEVLGREIYEVRQIGLEGDISDGTRNTVEDGADNGRSRLMDIVCLMPSLTNFTS